MTILPSPIPHPLDLLPWEVPGWVYEGLEWVIGAEWPDGNEKEVWDLADQWFAAASALVGPRDDAFTASGEVRRGYGDTGAVGKAFAEAWRTVADGDEAALVLLLTVSHDLGKLVEGAGCDIEGAKIEVWIEAGTLVIELLSLVVAMVLTAGAASPAAGAAMAATRTIIQQIFKRLIGQLARKTLRKGIKEAAEKAAKEVSERGLKKFARKAEIEGLHEAGEEFATDLGTQLYQNSTGRRDGLDLASLGMSTVGGFAGGAGASLAGLGGHASSRMGRFGEHVGREMSGEMLGEVAASVATGGGLPDLDDVTRAGTSGASSSSLTQSTHMFNAKLNARLNSLSDLPSSPTAPSSPTDLSGPPPTVAAPPSMSSASSPVSTSGDSTTYVGSSIGPAHSGGSRVDLAAVPVTTDPPVSHMGSAAAATTATSTDGGSCGVQTSAAPVQAGGNTGPVTATASVPVTAAAPVTPPVNAAPSTAATSPAVGASPAVDPSVGASASAGISVAAAPSTASTPTTVTPTADVSTGTSTAPATRGPSVSGTTSTTVTNPTNSSLVSASPATSPSTTVSQPVGNQPVRPQPLSQHPSESSGHTSAGDAPPPPTLSPRNRPSPRQQAVRQGLDRRGYRGYARSQREQHEQNRREDEATHLRGLGFAHRERASAYAANAIQLQRSGDRQMAQQWHDAANLEMQWAYHREGQADAILGGTLAPQRIDIQSEADFHRINDDVGNLADGGVQSGNLSALTGTGHPPSIDTTRPYGERGGLRRPLALHQTDLERHMPRDQNGNVVRTADPREGRWFRLTNDGGSRADPTRSINCLDCSLSFFDTWVHGRPRVSAPRTFDGYAAGNVNYPVDGEADGPGRVEDITGGRFQQLCPDVRHLQPAAAQQVVQSAYVDLQNQLLAGGHGSYAFIVNTWEGGASHAWVAVNQNGTVLYLDPQSGRISENAPLYAHSGVADDGNVASFDALVLDSNADPMPLAGRPQGAFSARPPITPPPVNPSSPDPGPADTDDAHYINKVYLLDGPTVAATPELTGAPAPGSSPPEGSSPTVDPREAEHQILASLDVEQRVALEGAVAQARAVADAVLQDLSAVVNTIAETADGDRPALVDTEYRAKELSSLARKFFTEHSAAGTEPELFLANANDLVRFSVQTPRDAYGSTVQTVLNGLEAQGYQLEDVKNFWRPGNRYNGVNVTMRTPGGHLMEIQFPTETSRSLGKKTHSLYEIVRLESAPASQRVDAFLEILKLNRDAGIADAIPKDLDALPEPKDTSFEKWAQRSGHVWMAYQRDLSAEGRTFAEVVAGRGLTIDDFPRGERLGLEDETGRVRLSRSVPTAGDTTDGTDRGAGVERAAAGRDLERAEAGVDVQPDGRGSVDLRRPVRGSTAAGEPSGSRADRPGALGDGAAERGRPVPDVPGGRTGSELSLGPPDGDVPSARSGAHLTIPPAEMLRDATAEELRNLGVGLATFADLGLDPDTLFSDERARYAGALPRTALVSPEQIRFTQRSVSRATSDGITAQNLIDNMRNGGWRGGPVHGVRWGDGSLSSLDNRRLRAAREAGLDVVPLVVHNPSDRLADWPQEWSPERQRKNALGLDIMQLADGRWVVGGDEGRVVYAKGTVPQTFGEIALFRAAEQRSLLPGHLFGADREPVLLGKPPAPNRAVELTDAEHRVLDDLRLMAHAVADEVQADLGHVARAVTAELGLSQPIELRGEEHRIKSAESLARKYDDEARLRRKSVEDFAHTVNDVLRFSLQLQSGAEYGRALRTTVEKLQAIGYRVDADPESMKNFWFAGNRFYGFNCTLHSPPGQAFELQFPTEASWRAGKLTHDLYEVMRREDELPSRRVHAFLGMLQVNRSLNIADGIPILDDIVPCKDATFAKWISKYGDVWGKYKTWLDLNNRSFTSVVAEFGLTAADFPVSETVATKLGDEDVQLLRYLRDEPQWTGGRNHRN